MTKQKATLIGLIAIVLWSTMVGLMRGVSEGLGPAGGAAMIFLKWSVADIYRRLSEYQKNSCALFNRW